MSSWCKWVWEQLRVAAAQQSQTLRLSDRFIWDTFHKVKRRHRDTGGSSEQTVERCASSHWLFKLQEKTDKIPITVSMHICDCSSYKHTHSHQHTHTHTHTRPFTHTLHSGEEHAWMIFILKVIYIMGLILTYTSGGANTRLEKFRGGWGNKRWLIGGENKSRHAKERMMRFFPPLCLCVFFLPSFFFLWYGW